MLPNTSTRGPDRGGGSSGPPARSRRSSVDTDTRISDHALEWEQLLGKLSQVILTERVESHHAAQQRLGAPASHSWPLSQASGNVEALAPLSLDGWWGPPGQPSPRNHCSLWILRVPWAVPDVLTPVAPAPQPAVSVLRRLADAGRNQKYRKSAMWLFDFTEAGMRPSISHGSGTGTEDRCQREHDLERCRSWRPNRRGRS
jgi:hypothetical protein